MFLRIHSGIYANNVNLNNYDREMYTRTLCESSCCCNFSSGKRTNDVGYKRFNQISMPYFCRRVPHFPL